MQPQAYQEPTQPGDLALPLVVGSDLLRRIIEVLRGSPEVRVNCWFCGARLQDGLCATCDDAGSAS